MRQIKRAIVGLFTLIAFFSSAVIFADAPVYSEGTQILTQQSTSSQNRQPQNAILSQPPLTLEQRLAKLERQMAFQNRQNLLAQITNLQQEIQDLRGQIEVQAYDLKKLRMQKNVAYKDSEKQGIPHSTLQPSQPTQSKNQNSNTPLTTSAKALPANQKQPTLSPPAAKNTSNPIAKNLQQASRTNATVNNSFLSDQNAYQAAYNLIKERQYEDAAKAMQNYLSGHTDGRYAANAHYWLGELLLLQNDKDKAITEFQTVIDHYSMSAKVGDALLKLGLIYYDNGQFQKATTELTKVGKQFPGTSAAQLAAARLQDMKQQTAKQ